MKVEHTTEAESNATRGEHKAKYTRMTGEQLKSFFQVRLIRKSEPIELLSIINECGETGVQQLRHYTKDAVLVHAATHINAEVNVETPDVELTIYGGNGDYWKLILAAHTAHELGTRLLCEADQCRGKSFNVFNELCPIESALDELDWDMVTEMWLQSDPPKAAGEAGQDKVAAP